MALKDAELENYYQDLFETFGRKGWKHVQSHFADMLASHNTLVGLNTVEELHYRKGQLDIIAQVINYQHLHEQAYNHIAAEETGDEPEAPTGGVAKVVADSADPDVMFE